MNLTHIAIVYHLHLLIICKFAFFSREILHSYPDAYEAQRRLKKLEKKP